MEKHFKLLSGDEAQSLFGKHDENIKLIEREFSVKIFARGEELIVSGDDANVSPSGRLSLSSSGKLIEELLALLREGRPLRHQDVQYAVRSLKEEGESKLHLLYLNKIEVSSKRQFVTPKSTGQKEYVEAIRTNDIVFGVGPAGTGKTYLAMATAVSALKKQEVSRIILTRPAIEAGENLGYLPGTLYEKITPYLRPLYDALYEMMELDKIDKFIERGIIEVAPLAYMRGRTLNDAFIILDEAQNTTSEQMKMFLTRIGFDSKAVITGDVTQIDLPPGKPSGLIQVQEILKDIEGIKFIYFSGKDVVRHELVQEIIKAYDKAKL